MQTYISSSFLKTNLKRKELKGRFFAHNKLENHTRKGEKERARRKKGREEKKQWLHS